MRYFSQPDMEGHNLKRPQRSFNNKEECHQRLLPHQLEASTRKKIRCLKKDFKVPLRLFKDQIIATAPQKVMTIILDSINQLLA
jgi:ribosomal protein L16/L10AE